MADRSETLAQGAGKPYGWAVERPGDNTFPRLYRTKAEADAMVEYVNVNPPATTRPLYASQPPVETKQTMPKAAQDLAMKHDWCPACHRGWAWRGEISDGSLSEGNANVGDRIGRTRRPAHPMDTISGGPIGPSDPPSSAGNVDEPTHEMVVAGSRSIGNTVSIENHMGRARACWAAMIAARSGVEEPIPSGRTVTTNEPQSSAVWRPIETAPKDGTWVLVWEQYINTKFHPAEVARFLGDRWVNSASKLIPNVAHWMPLPSSPMPRPLSNCGGDNA